jgi:hypothetical protein
MPSPSKKDTDGELDTAGRSSPNTVKSRRATPDDLTLLARLERESFRDPRAIDAAAQSRIQAAGLLMESVTRITLN